MAVAARASRNSLGLEERESGRVEELHDNGVISGYHYKWSYITLRLIAKSTLEWLEKCNWFHL